MKRAAVILGILTLVITSVAVWAEAQSSTQPAPQNPPAAGQAAPAQATTQGAAAAPTGKRPPQAKTQPEFDAYNAAAAITDPVILEKTSDDFAAKYPDSEIRILLYQRAMRLYLNANNDEKAEAMGRKVLSLDGDDPEALATVAEMIAERTHDSDLDRDQRYAEAISMAQKSTQTVDTDLRIQSGTPQEKIDASKAGLRAWAYSTIGSIEFKKENYRAAQENLQKSIDALPSNPDAVVVLRLALAIDKEATAAVDQGKKDKLYAEALKVADRAVGMTQDNTAIGTPARRERDRLQKLTEGTATAQPQSPPKN